MEDQKNFKSTRILILYSIYSILCLSNIFLFHVQFYQPLLQFYILFLNTDKFLEFQARVPNILWVVRWPKFVPAFGHVHEIVRFQRCAWLSLHRQVSRLN